MGDCIDVQAWQMHDGMWGRCALHCWKPLAAHARTSGHTPQRCTQRDSVQCRDVCACVCARAQPLVQPAAKHVWLDLVVVVTVRKRARTSAGLKPDKLRGYEPATSASVRRGERRMQRCVRRTAARRGCNLGVLW